MLQSGNLKKGEWIGLKTEKFITLERSNYTKEIVKYEHNIIESLQKQNDRHDIIYEQVCEGHEYNRFSRG